MPARDLKELKARWKPAMEAEAKEKRVQRRAKNEEPCEELCD